MGKTRHLLLPVKMPVRAENAGLFVSPGLGRHPDRVIDSYELIVVRSGCLRIVEDKSDFSVSAGESLLLFPGRRHRGAGDYEPGLSFYWVHFHVESGGAGGRGRKASGSLQAAQHVRLARPERIKEWFHRFLDDQKTRTLAPAQANLLVMLMLSEVGLGAGAPDASSRTAAVVGRAEAYIDTHFHEPISSASVAAALGYNPDYLSRLLQRRHGLNVTEFIQRRRIGEACVLLRDTALNVKQVAGRCGFRSPGYLRRIFSRHEGMSPATYRRMYAHVHVNVR